MIYSSLFPRVLSKRDLDGLKFWRFACNTRSETLHPNFTPQSELNRNDLHPRPFHIRVPPRGIKAGVREFRAFLGLKNKKIVFYVDVYLW